VVFAAKPLMFAATNLLRSTRETIPKRKGSSTREMSLYG
jgi:hypothetical protein